MPTPDDDRLDRLVELVVSLASGDLDARMAPSSAADSVDAVVVGFNMLAEELQALYAGLEARVAERTELLEQAQLDLERLALYDPLTGLANRTLLSDRMDQALAHAQRSRCSLAVMVLDLDGFKAVNDSYGHAAGDLVLAEIARRLRTVARSEDTVARLGGDEFALVIADAGHEQVLAVAERVRHAVSLPVRAGDVTCQVGASVGICFAPAGQSEGSLLRNADIAMYSAKLGDGRGIATYRPAMQAAASLRSRLADELRTAVELDQLVLHYQPVVDLERDAVVGVEALVRWQHPVRGLVSPADFISVTEETGIIVELGRWVADRALGQLARWREDILGEQPFRLHVNTSPVQLRAPGYAAEVLGLLEHHRLDAGDLWLEITESEMIDDEVATWEVFRVLRAAGVGLVMDDFGTGYASIGYVRRLPIDVIKVDRSLISGLHVDAQQHGVASAILALADAVGLQAVAEGVETEGESAALRDLGYRYAQGFHFGRPAPAQEITAALHRAMSTSVGMSRRPT